ncbi:hypothetical protein SAMD00020551_0154 [Mesobacillus selenatarsenatis SF-1]|uniref:DNA helicase n=2 Tax=Mesobacillus selenatarsenatis TaxID=388741 RepID=A0A0A8WWK7_MESS1|nr:hypothetical protein SAMD00020551_0154 [Mesobacillus selenatarsenatis SF-1]
MYKKEETIELKQPFVFILTNNMKETAAELGLQWNTLAHEIAGLQNLLVRLNAAKRELRFITSKAIFVCAINTEYQFIIKTTVRKNARSQAEFVKDGVSIYSPMGFSIKEGNSVLSGPTVNVSSNSAYVESVLPEISAKMAYTVIENEEAEELSISEELESFLETAKAYNDIEDELERNRSLGSPRHPFTKLSSVTDQSRVKQLTYQFLCSEIEIDEYKPGTRLLLTLSDMEIPATLEEIQQGENEHLVKVLLNQEINHYELGDWGFFQLEYNSVQTKTRLKVVEQFEEMRTKATYLYKGIGHNEFSPIEEKGRTALEEELNKKKYPPNESQIEAISKGIHAEDPVLVLGPPGTGKTTVIVEWVKHFVKKENKRVLISSQNNKAVDNVLAKLADDEDMTVIRVGREEKVQENVKPFLYEMKEAEMKESISNSLAHYSPLVDRTLATVKDRINSYSAFIEKLSNYLEKKEYLDGYYRQWHETYLSRLRVGSRAVHALRETIAEGQERIDRKVSFLEDRKNKSLGIKMLTYPGVLFSKGTMFAAQRKIQAASEEMAMTLKELDGEWLRAKAYKNERIDPLKQDFAVIRELINSTREGLKTERIDGIWGEDIEAFHIDSYNRALLKEVERYIEKLEDFKVQLLKVQTVLNSWRDQMLDHSNSAISEVLLESVNVVGATCIGINSQSRFQHLEFDVTIIDESGQIQLHNAFVPMSRSPKLIMLGDHLQIPPIVDEDILKRAEEKGIRSDLLGKSLFEELYSQFPETNKVLLDTQYRMPHVISDILSEEFYEGKYHAHESKTGLNGIGAGFNSPFVLIDTGKDSNRLEKKHENGGYVNPLEIDIVVKLVRHLVEETGYSLNDMGIIAPYRAQIDALKDAISKAFPEYSERDLQDIVATLDSFQGQERPIIIYSGTRSNRKAEDQKRIGFLAETRRLNVALSRAEEQLFFIGDFPFLSSCDYEEVIESDDLYGEDIVHSERPFSRFIRRILSHVEMGNVQMLPVEKLMEGIDKNEKNTRFQPDLMIQSLFREFPSLIDEEVEALMPIELPIAELILELEERSTESFQIVEEAILDLIAAGLTDVDLISDLLGLTPRYVLRIIQTLESYGHIRQSELTEQGKQSLKERQSITTYAVIQKIQAELVFKQFLPYSMVQNDETLINRQSLVPHRDIVLLPNATLNDQFTANFLNNTSIYAKDQVLHTNVERIKDIKGQRIKFAPAYLIKFKNKIAFLPVLSVKHKGKRIWRPMVLPKNYTLALQEHKIPTIDNSHFRELQGFAMTVWEDKSDNFENKKKEHHAENVAKDFNLQSLELLDDGRLRLDPGDFKEYTIRKLDVLKHLFIPYAKRIMYNERICYFTIEDEELRSLGKKLCDLYLSNMSEYKKTLREMASGQPQKNALQF